MSEDRAFGVCASYEPHIWRRNKCKNCFHSKSEHKRALKSQQSFADFNGPMDDPSLHLDFVDGHNSDDLFTPRQNDGDRHRKDYKEELRETMLRMEVQMHDYKEVSRLRQMVRSLGGDPRDLSGSGSVYDSESAAESDYSVPAK